jgi:hypothetical protein
MIGAYLGLRLLSMPALLFFFYGQQWNWLNGYCFNLYFYTYWAVFTASAVLLYFVCLEIFRAALAAFPGFQRLGAVVFHWAALASVIVSLSAVSLDRPHDLVIANVACRIMRSVSVLELCLLAFLCLSMNSLQLSVRDMTFGIPLGFGLMSSSDLILALFWSRSAQLTDLFQFVSESLILLSLGIWIVYAALPEPVRKPLTVPVNSLIFRWNEIATALGHTGTRVAMPQPSNGFFLTDVEQVVEAVQLRKLTGRRSESEAPAA